MPTFHHTAPDGRDEGLRVDSLLRVDGVAHLVLAVFDDAVLLVSIGTHHVYLVQDQRGGLRTPSRAEVEALMASGRAEPMRSPGDRVADDAERMRMEIGLLDAAAVPNGTKAITIHLFAAWTADLVERFGPHDHPATIKRWRTAASRRRARGPP